MPGVTTFAKRKIAIGAPRAICPYSKASAQAFCRPYSLTGQVGAFVATYGVSPSKTWFVDKKSTYVSPSAAVRIITPMTHRKTSRGTKNSAVNNGYKCSPVRTSTAMCVLDTAAITARFARSSCQTCSGTWSDFGWSAYPLILSVKADITAWRLGANSRPEQVQRNRLPESELLNHLVGERKHMAGNVDAKQLCYLIIDRELKFSSPQSFQCG
jgi:hypothetical protein